MKYVRIHVQTGGQDYEVSGIDVERVVMEAGQLAARLGVKRAGTIATIRIVTFIDI